LLAFFFVPSSALAFDFQIYGTTTPISGGAIFHALPTPRLSTTTYTFNRCYAYGSLSGPYSSCGSGSATLSELFGQDYSYGNSGNNPSLISDSATAGDWFYIATTTSQPGVRAFTKWTISGGTSTVPTPDLTTHFETIDISTSTRTVTVTGYTEAASSTARYEISVVQGNAAYGLTRLALVSDASAGFVRATTTGFFAYTFGLYYATTSTSTVSLLGSDFTVTADLDRVNLGTDQFSTDYRSLMDTISASYSVDGGIDIYNPYDVSAVPDNACSVTQFVGCLKNLIIWAFYPPPSAVEQFQSIRLNEKMPFAYAYDVPVIYSEIFASGATSSLTVSASTTMGTFVFLSADLLQSVPFSGQVRTLMGYMLWFFFLEFCYYQVLGAHNPFRKHH